MPKEQRPVIQLEDGEGNQLHVTWSRSWKRLIMSVVPGGRWEEHAHVELDAEQAEKIRKYIEETTPR